MHIYNLYMYIDITYTGILHLMLVIGSRSQKATLVKFTCHKAK